MTRATLRFVCGGALLALLIVVVETRYAEPIQDSDLFWHFAYAQQMLERGTLMPDPTIYSWTPVNDRTLYCAWLAELLLYALWSSAGWSGLFALRYLVVVAVAALFWLTQRRLRLPIAPTPILVLLVLIVTAYNGTLLKPEIFSLLGFHGVLFCYFAAKSADREGKDARGWFYAVPAIVLLWANAHGGFVLLVPLLAATASGEALNRRFSPGLALSRASFGHMIAAWSLCAVAACGTPYGIAYPLQHLKEFATGSAARPDTVWNVAYQPIWAFDPWQFLSLPQLFALIAAATIVAIAVFARRPRAHGRRIDYSLAVSLVAYLPLSVMIARASYFWPAVACYALAYLAHLRRADRPEPATEEPRSLIDWRTAAPITAIVVLASTSIHGAYARPGPGSWTGFGIGYVNPVPEAEYLAKAQLGDRFYNTFDSGGYLLWRLYPQYRVMVDPRSFPYLEWFKDQFDFANGTSFDEFLAKYRADVAVIDLLKVGCWRNFLRAPDWRLLFYGPTAAVFARRSIPVDQKNIEVAGELLELRNAGTAVAALDFALAAGGYDIAWNIIGQLETRLRSQADADDLLWIGAYRDAHAALIRGAYDDALRLFERSLTHPLIADRDRAIVALLRNRAARLQRGDTVGAEADTALLAQMALPASLGAKSSARQLSP